MSETQRRDAADRWSLFNNRPLLGLFQRLDDLVLRETNNALKDVELEVAPGERFHLAAVNDGLNTKGEHPGKKSVRRHSFPEIANMIDAQL